MDKENKTEIYATLLDYVENNLPQEKRKEVEEFLEQNPTYKQDVENYDGKITLPMPKRTDKEKKITPEVIKLKVYGQKMKKQRNIMRVMTTISSVAAVVLLIVMIVPPTQDNISAIAQNNTQNITKEIRTVYYINDTTYLRDTTIIRDTIKIEKDLFEEFDRKFNNNLQTAGMITIEKDRETDYPLRMKFANTDNLSIGGSQFIYKDNSNNGFIHTVAYNPYDKQIIGRQDFMGIQYSAPSLEQLYDIDKIIHKQIEDKKNNTKDNLVAKELLTKVRDDIQKQVQEQEGKNLASTKFLKKNFSAIDGSINPAKYDVRFVRKEDLSQELLLAMQEIEDIKEGNIHFKIYEDIENSLVYCIVDNIITNK
ncbi:MAG: hypothetical protein IJ759_02110 [Bacteroidales bacterium]|nr:hypothetical protein [Bacteroidales bacterium]